MIYVNPKVNPILEEGKIYRDNITNQFFTPASFLDFTGYWEVLILSGPKINKMITFRTDLGQDYDYVEDYKFKHKFMLFFKIQYSPK